MQDSCGNFGGNIETDCHATNSRICLCRGMHNWRGIGIGKIDFPSVKWMLFKTIAESFSNDQKKYDTEEYRDKYTTEEGEREKKRSLKISWIVLVISRLQEEYLF